MSGLTIKRQMGFDYDRVDHWHIFYKCTSENSKILCTNLVLLTLKYDVIRWNILILNCEVLKTVKRQIFTSMRKILSAVYCKSFDQFIA